MDIREATGAFQHIRFRLYRLRGSGRLSLRCWSFGELNHIITIALIYPVAGEVRLVAGGAKLEEKPLNTMRIISFTR